mmetsp:Transcript_102249/g.243816  ORF Transcript_102249/g.243816 Transcript_102249/m.243816 type:complete len:207 (-) Transcript_102249:45-665(-)
MNLTYSISSFLKASASACLRSAMRFRSLRSSSSRNSAFSRDLWSSSALSATWSLTFMSSISKRSDFSVSCNRVISPSAILTARSDFRACSSVVHCNLSNSATFFSWDTCISEILLSYSSVVSASCFSIAAIFSSISFLCLAVCSLSSSICRMNLRFRRSNKACITMTPARIFAISTFFFLNHSFRSASAASICFSHWSSVSEIFLA